MNKLVFRACALSVAIEFVILGAAVLLCVPLCLLDESLMFRIGNIVYIALHFPAYVVHYLSIMNYIKTRLPETSRLWALIILLLGIELGVLAVWCVNIICVRR